MKQITGGLYLVLDPKPGIDQVKPKVELVLKAGLDVLQIWDHWNDNQDKIQFVNSICESTHKENIPVLVNENIELLKLTKADGIHFDHIPDKNPDAIRSEFNRKILIGLTCGNDMKKIDWAAANGIDYISFCAMFPSPSVGDCEIVKPDTIRKARTKTDIPIFVSGGITPENLMELKELKINGAAVISGILKSENPGKAASEYKNVLDLNLI